MFWAAMFAMAVAANGAQAGAPWGKYAKKTDDWYRGPEGQRIAANVLSFQTAKGDWPKNTDTSAKPYEGDPAKIKGTFDNSATVGELRFLARFFRATAKVKARDAFIKGIDHILAAQYPTGGWPQTSPPGKSYPRYITFNDNTMINLMELLRDVAGREEFQFVDEERRLAARKAFEAGVRCILKCQVRVNSALTVWCAQHDEVTLEPRPARAYELISLSGSESAEILILLMSLDQPGPEVIKAVKDGVRWFEKVKLTGLRQQIVDGNKVIVRDLDAPPLWARFYEIGTDRPFFCGRDGVKKYQIDEIEPERRNGYGWYGDWGTEVAHRFAKWSATQGTITPAKP